MSFGSTYQNNYIALSYLKIVGMVTLYLQKRIFVSCVCSLAAVSPLAADQQPTCGAPQPPVCNVTGATWGTTTTIAGQFTNNASNQLSAGAQAGIAIGVIFGVALIVLGAVLIYKFVISGRQLHHQSGGSSAPYSSF